MDGLPAGAALQIERPGLLEVRHGEAVPPLPVVPGQQLVGERLQHDVTVLSGVFDRPQVATDGPIGIAARPGPLRLGQREVGAEIVGVELGEGPQPFEDLLDLRQFSEAGGGHGVMHPEEVGEQDRSACPRLEIRFGPRPVGIRRGVVAEQGFRAGESVE